MAEQMLLPFMATRKTYDAMFNNQDLFHTLLRFRVETKDIVILEHFWKDNDLITVFLYLPYQQYYFAKITNARIVNAVKTIMLDKDKRITKNPSNCEETLITLPQVKLTTKNIWEPV